MAIEEKLTTTYSFKGAEKVAEEKLTTEYSVEWVCYEELPLTEQTFKTTIVNEIISLEDSLPVADQVSQAKWTLNEFMRLFEVKMTAMQLIEGQYVELVGQLFAPGSEVPVPGAVVHIYDLNNRVNLPEYITTTDEEGFFKLKLPIGEYILVATKQGYSLGWVYFVVRPILEEQNTTIFIAPLSPGNCVEKIFSAKGFMYKVYSYNKYEDPSKTKEIIEGILVIGDPYNWASNSDEFSTDGTLEAITPGATLELVDLPEVGITGFFDSGETVERVGDNVIYFTTTLRKGDFDCFGFRIMYPKGRLPLIRLKIGTDIVFKDDEPPDPPKDDIEKLKDAEDKNNSESNNNRRRGDGGGRPWIGWYSCWSRGWILRHWDVCLGLGIKLYPQLFTKYEEHLMMDLKGDIIRLYERPFEKYLHLSDSLKVEEGYLYPGYMLFSDKITLKELEVYFPANPSIMGVVTDEQGNPIEGAKVYVFYAGTDILVASTATDENGFYRVDVPSEKEYDVIIVKEGRISGKVLVSVRESDVIDDRCRAYLDSEGFVRAGDRWYYVAVLRLAEGGKIYGYVYNRKTLEPVPNVKVIAKLGQYENYGISDENGYYEIFVPRGEWELEARKPGFKPAKGLKAVIQSNYRQDIYLDPATITGYVWDAVESSSTGIRKPIAGAKVRIGDSETTTDEKGYFTLETVEGEQEIVIEAPRYKTLKKMINVVTGGNYEFYLWKVSAYDDSGGRVTIKLVDNINIKGG